MDKFTIENLDLYYGSFRALKSVNLKIQSNDITAFIGPSGCGKSTLLKSLNRMNDLVEGCRITGTVNLDDENIYGDMDINLLRKRVGMVFQKPNPFPMSIYDNIAFGPRTHGVRSKAQLDEIVEISLRNAAIWEEVKDRLGKSALGLSGGQQQRLCIARALAVEPEVLLMDEPTSALDPISTAKIEDLVAELKKNYTIVAVILSLVLALRVSKKIVKPLNELNLDDPLSNEGYDELSPLLRRINNQQRQIEMQLLKLKQKQNEFETVTASMNEGLVLLNEKSSIIGLNRAAARLLNIDENCIGHDVLTINRSLDLQVLLGKAQMGKRVETVIDLERGKYQLDVNPVLSDEGKILGFVLLMFDVTEKEKTEQIRREFTANVSHELKTPLHSISGCAELLSSGMVKSEDVPQFLEQINSEAQRMTRLVDDIIRLSHLDEGIGEMQFEEVELSSLIKETLKRLAPEAEMKNISLKFSGESVRLNGISQLLGSIIFNLCENAIKYNREGGKVEVNLTQNEHESVLTVADSGIGISVEHQNRIFERFYRVDKSHSKEIGGTGLGLSIVKHAARLHNAKIELRSVPDEGTTIILRFPRK